MQTPPEGESPSLTRSILLVLAVVVPTVAGVAVYLHWTTDTPTEPPQASACPPVPTDQPVQLAQLETLTFVKGLAFSPDGQTLAVAGSTVVDPGGKDVPSVALWDVAERRRSALLRRPKQAGSLWALAYSPDGKTLACGGTEVIDDKIHGFITLWDPATEKEVAHVSEVGKRVTHLAWTKDGKTLASATLSGWVSLWNVPSLEQKSTHRAEPRGLLSMTLAGDGSFLTTAGLKTPVRIWELPSWKERRTLGESTWATLLAPDGKTLIVAKGTNAPGLYEPVSLWLWDLGSARVRAKWPIPHRGPIDSMGVSDDGRKLVAGGVELLPDGSTRLGFVSVWDLKAGTRPYSEPFRAVDSGTCHVAISPDGTKIACGGFERRSDSSTGVVILWDLPTKSK